jgi:hypothetical protein
VTRLSHPGLKIFSMLFGAFYIIAFYFDLALFRYYPEARQFHWARTDGIGSVILWYGWIVTAALASAAVAVAVPRSVADRLSSRWVWVVTALVVLVTLIYERRWFV